MEENKQEEVSNNNEPALTKKEQKEQKRQEKIASREADARTRRNKKLVTRIGWVLAVIGIGLLIWHSTAEPRELGEDFSIFVPESGTTHLAEGTDVDYETNPPTSGNHWPNPVRDGVYDRSQPDEGLVHSLEHGRIWISYKSSVPQEIVDQINEIGNSYPRMVVTVREENEKDIAVAAWTRYDNMSVEEFSVDRILDFRQRYDDTGPEKGIPAHTGKIYE